MANTHEAHPVTIAPAGSLQPVLSERYALGWQHTLLCSFFALLFVYISYIPLSHTETWRHAALGRSMLESGTLPAAKTILPLAEGMPYVSTAWLSQVIIAGVQRLGGEHTLTNLLAICQVISLILLAMTFFQQSQMKLVSLTGTVIVVGMWWGQLGILRPQVLGAACLAALLSVLVRTLNWGEEKSWGRLSVKRWMWFALPALMLLWANLDGSFVVGIAALAAWSLGSAIDKARETRSLIAALRCRNVRRAVYLAELSIIVTLINPLGVELWAHAVRWNSNPMWQAAGGNRPLVLASGIGVCFALYWGLTIVLFRHSRCRICTMDVLLLAGVSIAVTFNELLIWWFAPLAVFVIIPHVSDVTRRWITSPGRQHADNQTSSLATAISRAEPTRPLRFGFTLTSCLIVWLAFALSPVSTPILGGTPRAVEKLHNQRTPLGVSKFLRENPPDKLVWAPQDWGDWLVWDGPRDLQVFANSAASALPRQVRYDYLQVWRGASHWQRLLDRYDVGVLVIDKQRQERLMRAALRSGPTWDIAMEDHQSLVLRRRPEANPLRSIAPTDQLAMSGERSRKSGE